MFKKIVTGIALLALSTSLLLGKDQSDIQSPTYLYLLTHSEVTCLAKTIYFEARGEPVKGQQAVALVTVNRALHPSFPSSICETVYQKGQYSWTSMGVKVRDKEAWERAKDIAYHTLNSYDELKSFTALYFHATHVSPNWKKRRIAKIGNHIFYAQ